MAGKMAAIGGRSVFVAALSFVGGAVACKLWRGELKDRECGPFQCMSLLTQSSGDAATSCTAHIQRLGYPSKENLHFKADHVLSYNNRMRSANWVFEVLTADRCYNKLASRDNCSFRPDEQVSALFRSNDADFKRSRFDRGHLAAAANHFHNQNAMDDTFLFTNISPQVGAGFNRDGWNNLERHVRRLTRRYARVFVFTGPLYMPRPDNSGRQYVSYEVIGQNMVSVPTHFFKVIACQDKSSPQLSVESYIMPNKKVDEEQPLTLYHRDLSVVEKYAGLEFFRAWDQKQLRKTDVHTLYRTAKI